MDNKDILARNYETHYTTAMKLLQKGELPDAKRSFQRALDCAVKLMSCTMGGDKASYKAKADNVADLIDQINQKMQEGSKPATGGGPAASAGAQPKEPPKPREDKPTVEDAMKRLNDLTGLTEVKKEVATLVAELQVQLMCEAQGIKRAATNHHLVFKGNPGTGKTTVARIMADIFYALGVIKNGQLVEVQRTDLVAGYVGQTAVKTQETIDSAMGGVLFIDEVYTLVQGGENDFGKEAINTLLTALENHREDFIVIVAGYDNLMDEFMDANPGLKSRFPNTIHFCDYKGDEMFKIFEGMCKKDQFKMTDEVKTRLAKHFDDMYANRDENFGNARDVRNFFEKIKKNHSTRVYGMTKNGQPVTVETLTTILAEDLPR